MLRSLLTSAAKPSAMRMVRPALTQAKVHTRIIFTCFLYIKSRLIAWICFPCWSTRGKKKKKKGAILNDHYRGLLVDVVS
jgi:hypothetical protein